MKMLLPHTIAFISVLLALAWEALIMNEPLSLGQQCLVILEGSHRGSPVKLSSRMAREDKIVLINAVYGMKTEPRYGACVVSGKRIDSKATDLTITELIETSSRHCLTSKVFYCRVGGRGQCHRAYQAWRDPTATELEERRQNGTCSRLDRNSSWVQAEFKRRYYAALGAEHIENW